MAKKIRDTIHGYIHLTKIEEAVSQHPLVLRLHYIHQTSFTYLTYPNTHSTRYPHALGVMHLAGKIFRSALANTSGNTLGDVADVVLNVLGNKLNTALKEEFHESRLKEDREVYYDTLDWGVIYRAAEFDDRFSNYTDLYVPLLVLFQATRLAGLLHDVGHPPFSHIVEYALLHARGDGESEHDPKRYLGHETVGEILIGLISNSDLLRERSGFRTAPHFSSACMLVCQKILSSQPGDSFYDFKKSLVSGPVDADRLDYVRRDAYSAGMVPRYDIRPLIDGASLRKTKTGFAVTYQSTALGAVENFFQARNDLYRYMIYHHDVARRNLAVQRLLVRALDVRNDLPPSIFQAANYFAVRAAGAVREGYQTYESYDDSAFISLLRCIDEELNLLEKPDAALKIYLDVILRRRNDFLRSLIKRPDGYARLAKQVINEVRIKAPNVLLDNEFEAVPALNRLLREKFDRIRERVRTATRQSGENVAKIRLAELLEQYMAEAAPAFPHPEQAIRFKCYYFGTFSPGLSPDFRFSEAKGENGELVNPSDISPVIATLGDTWANSPQVAIFFEMPGGGAQEIATRLRGDYLPYAVSGIVNFLVSSNEDE